MGGVGERGRGLPTRPRATLDISDARSLQKDFVNFVSKAPCALSPLHMGCLNSSQVKELKSNYGEPYAREYERQTEMESGVLSPEPYITQYSSFHFLVHYP